MLLCLCGCEAVNPVLESSEPQKASNTLLATIAEAESTDELEATTTSSVDIDVPDLKLAFLVIGRGTKTENDTQAIAKHLCERRGIVLEVISYRATSESICMDIKRAFQEAHVYFTSDFEEDIGIAHTQFNRWRRR